MKLSSRILLVSFIFSFFINWKVQPAEGIKLHRKYPKALSKFAKKVVGVTIFDLDNVHCAHLECNIGNLVTDAIRDYVSKFNKTLNSTELNPIVFYNAGGIRGFLKKGNLTIGDLSRALPYDSVFMHIRMNGRCVTQVVKQSLSQIGTSGFLQVSGGRILATTKKKTAPKVIQTEIGDEYLNFELAQNSSITDLVIPNYVIFGGDAYHDIHENAEVEEINVPGERRILAIPEKHPVPKLSRAEVGDKYFNFELIQNSTIYDVIVPKFLFSGGDGYYHFKENASLVMKYDKMKLSFVVQKYIATRSPILPRVEGRIYLGLKHSYLSHSTTLRCAITIINFFILFLMFL